ncbi:MAG: hypothetical protein AAFX79_03575 [Planctomycetota bacterium]
MPSTGHSPDTRTPTWLSIAAMLMAACPALAQEGTEPKEGAAPILGGPSVEAAATRATLVSRTYAGELERLSRHPAEAALDFVEPPEATRPAIEAILAERRAVLDGLVIDRLDLLIKLGNGGGASDRREAIAELARAMAPLARKGALGDRIRAELPPEAAAEHERLEQEYNEAALADRVRLLSEERRGGERGLRFRARAIERLVGLGAEVRSAYERTLLQRAQELDELIAKLDLTPDQESNVRRIIQRYGEKTLLNPDKRSQTERDRLGVFLEVAKELTPEQRRTLIRISRGEA